MTDLKISDIAAMLRKASAEELEVLERSLADDTRKGVIKAIAAAHARLDACTAEVERVDDMYQFELNIAKDHGAKTIVGLDEVGRGPLAGPLAVGAVVLKPDDRIYGLNDSKKLSGKLRAELASQVKERAIAWSVFFVDAKTIDEKGITASLKFAFSSAVSQIEGKGVHPDIVLLDGNPLRFDEREVNVVKGDGLCASIAAASIVAKEERDALMRNLAKVFPQYGFDENKGYGTEMHRDALRRYGLCEIHRRSFCSEFLQSSLF